MIKRKSQCRAQETNLTDRKTIFSLRMKRSLSFCINTKLINYIQTLQRFILKTRY
jgi:hypothetical protein